MYRLYLDEVLYPVPPSKVTEKINNANKTYTLLNGEEINVLKNAQLTDISFEILLPNAEYPWATYENGFHTSAYYLELLEKLKTSKKHFQYVMSRELPDGTTLFDTDMSVTLEDYKVVEDTKNGFDVVVSINLKQYREYGTKAYIKKKGNKTIKKSNARQRKASKNAPSNKLPLTYTVVKGDSLWLIAKRYYGNGSKYTLIYKANKGKIKNANLIYPGQKLFIPKES